MASAGLVIPRNCEPVEHRAPLPRIDLSPKYEPFSQPPQEPWEAGIEEAARAFTARENERIWQELQQIASGNG